MSFIWNRKSKGKDPTVFWNSINKKQFDVCPVASNELFGEKDSIHDRSKIIHRLIPIPVGQEHTVEDWTNIIEEAFHGSSDLFATQNGKTIREMAVRMAVSNPSQLFEEAIWDEDLLRKRHDTTIWKAAYELFGAPWEEQVAPVTPTKEGELPEEVRGEKRKDIVATDSTEDLEPPRKLFLSKPVRKHATTSFNLVEPSYKRKYTTYCKVKLPKVTKESIMEMEHEVIGYVQRLLIKLFSIDSKIVIYPWNNDNNIRPLTKTSATIKTREVLAEYVDRVFITKGYNMWCRLLLGHDKKIETIGDDQKWFKSQGMWFNKDDIQVKDPSASGWLLGSHMSMNAQDLADALRQHPKLEDIPIAIRFQAIRLSARGRIPNKEQVKAAHVLTDQKLVAKVRAIMREIYQSDPGEFGYPLGIVMRFVPNIADTRYKGNTLTRSNVKKLKMKQQQFLKNTTIQTSTAVQSIDHHISDIGSLRYIVMGLQTSSEEDNRNLFISVEENHNSGLVTFIYRTKYEDQATSTIQALPLILEANYGPRCGSWIGPTAKEDTAGWSYDKDTGVIKSIDDDYTTNLYDEWDQDVIPEEPIANEFEIHITEPTRGNNYDDNGTVGTGGSLSGWSSASEDEPSIGRLLSKMTKMMTIATPDQIQQMHNVITGTSRGGDSTGRDNV